MMVLSAALIALVLSGCFLIPKPVVTFTAPTSANVSAYPVNTPITFKWTGNQSNLKYTLTIAASGATPITLLNDGAVQTLTATVATPGVYTATISAKNNTGGVGQDTTTFNVSSLEILNSTPVYADNNVTVSWKSLDGQAHTYQYTVGATWFTTTSTSVTFSNLPDGNYTFRVNMENSYVPAATYKFQVLTAGPTIGIRVSDRTEGGFYGIGSHPQGRYADISWSADQKLGSLWVRFYMFGPYGTGIRYRLNISSTGSWIVLPATSTQQQWYVINPADLNSAYGIVVSATGPAQLAYFETSSIIQTKPLEVQDLSGNTYEVPAFEFGKTYSIGLQPFNWLGTAGTFNSAPFVLSERYSTSDMPEIYVNYDKTSVATGGSFTASVKMPNVTAYSSGTHEIINDNVDHTDITSNDGLMYTQFSVQLSAGLKIDNVAFPDMMAGKVNLSDYTYDPSNGILTVYRGFVDPTDGATTATSSTDTAVEIQCTVPATFTAPEAYVELDYVGSDNPGIEGDSNYNPVFKDNSLRNIDGVVTVGANPGVAVDASGKTAM